MSSPRANSRLSFSATVPNLQIAWDSTSLGTFKSCPRKYQLSIVEGWTGKYVSHHLRFGTLYHRALEVYDHKRALGAGHDEALAACLRDLAEGCMDEGEAGRVWWNPEEGMSEAKAKTNTKTVETLFRTVVWYLDQFGASDPAETIILANGKPGVELSFRFDAGFSASSGEPYLFCGHLDRVVQLGSERYIMDRKTTGSTISGYFFDQFSPDNQMTLYTIAGKVAFGEPVKGVIIDGAQIAKGFSRFERGFALRTEGQLDEWLADARFWISQAEAMAVAGYWPMNDKSCNDYGGCTFRGICQKDPAVRELWLRDHGQRMWDPLQVRGDI